MPLPVCPLCNHALRTVAQYWSGGQRYWSVFPHDTVSFTDTCQDLRTGFAEGIYWCPVMRQALNPELPPDPASPPEPRTMRTIMGLFQSLGDNCEFGLIQRWAEQEPLDLLRFAGFLIPVEHRLQQTIKALTEGFAGLGDPASVMCELHGENYPREFMILETRWQLFYHTGTHEGGADPEVLRLQQTKTLQFKRRKLFEDLESAHQVFVWKSNLPTPERDVRALVACLRHYGPNLLLWVNLADHNHPDGLVEYAGDGLLKGYVARFAPYDAAGDIEFSSWHAVCRNAAVAADYLRRCGEWASPSPGASPPEQPSAMPLGEVSLEEAASALHWEERRSESLAVGPVVVNAAEGDTTNANWFRQNPGSQDIRSALLSNIVMDSANSVLLQAGRKIRETKYLVETEEDYERVRPILSGLRLIETDKIAVIGFNRAFRNFHHWMVQSLAALDLSFGRIGAERCVLVLPPLTVWQEETLSMLGLADIPRITVDLSHHYYFARAYFSEYLNGKSSFFLSPRSLEVFDKLAAGVEQTQDGPELLYVARSDSSNRAVTNEKEVEALMATSGFTSVVPGSLSIRDQVRLFRSARVVVGPHGAGLTNIAFCKPGTKVLELVQASYANPCINRIAQTRQLEYHAAFFESAANADVHKQSWHVDPTRLVDNLRRLLMPHA
jgi:hypothetical protein